MQPDVLDVLIVGAGITGIGFACHLRMQLPQKSFAILEREPTFGGTWHTNRYPGARSDSDLYTYGYRFKPWRGRQTVATREEILVYMGEAIAEYGLGSLITYGVELTEAAWSSEEKLWTVAGRRTSDGSPFEQRARFLAMCQGYYHHRRGHTPDWPGLRDYGGRIVHAQEWPDALDYDGKSIIVIGSGATAATAVPVLAERSGPITLLQRSPTYYFISPQTGLPGSATALSIELRALGIEDSWIHEICRRKSIKDEATFIERTFAESEVVKAELIGAVRALLPASYDVETHFTPRYRPWQQRVAYVPDGDFLKAIGEGKVTVVTDVIKRFKADAIQLRSGRELSADLVLLATGFDLCILGDIAFSKDGRPIDVGETINYRGLMLSGIPNLTWTFGYLRASWTLRADMNADFLCRLIGYMDEKGLRSATPELLPEERDLPRLPWVDPASFNGGYIMRSIDKLPKRIDRPEWQHLHDYWQEKDLLPAIDLDDGRLVYA